MQQQQQPPTTDVTPVVSTKSAYKASEKRFKQLSETQIRSDAAVLDVRALQTDDQLAKVARVGTWKWRSPLDGSERERPVLSFSGFGDQHEGFFVIPDAVDAATQLQIAHACLTEYVEPPHVTNMHQQNEQIAEIWRKALRSHPSDPSKNAALTKLHWGAAGFHYDWTARKYYPHDVSPVPQLLSELGASCAQVCGETLVAEAVIVNFYKKNSTMGGHQDDVEYTMDHPVVSLSLGSDCVFLKGSLTKEDAPLEVLLRSGDLAVLSGKSRLSYHGIAKVFPTPLAITETELETLVESKATTTPQKEEPATDLLTKDDWRKELLAVKRYLATHRININIRQVYATNERPSSTEQAASKRQKLNH